MRIFNFFLLTFFLLTPAGATDSRSFLSSFDFEISPALHWRLPKQLSEISGLAMNAEGELFAHNDETAAIYQIDWYEGKFIKTFFLGNFATRDDFEGLAIIGTHFFLITSDGLLYEFREGNDGDTKAFNTIDTGLKKKCEVEGLASSPAGGKLFILCKKGRGKAFKNRLTIFSWDITGGPVPEIPYISIDLTNPDFPKYIQDMEPTSVEVLPGGSGFLVASSKGHVLLEIDDFGKLRAWRRLKKKRHPQTEGITISPKGNLIISDEGKPGILAVYKPRLKVSEQ